MRISDPRSLPERAGALETTVGAELEPEPEPTDEPQPLTSRAAVSAIVAAAREPPSVPGYHAPRWRQSWLWGPPLPPHPTRFEEFTGEEGPTLEFEFAFGLQVAGFAAGVDVGVVVALVGPFAADRRWPEIGTPAPPAIGGIVALVR